MRTAEDIKRIIEEKDINTVYLQFTDISGKVKNIAMPVAQIDDILNNEISFDGSSITGFRKNETMDLVFYPDLESFLVYPFKFSTLKNSARLICDIHNADGTPFEGCPRSNLKRVITNAKKYNYTMNIGPEVEFFLFKTDENNNIISKFNDTVGYYDLNSDENLEEVLNQIVTALQDCGYTVEAVHHEGAPLQHEIDLGYDNVLRAADNFSTFKFVLKTMAAHFGLKATFMPKPVYGINGSGLHLNISLSLNEKNAYYDEEKNDMLSDVAKFSVGALLKNILGITALLNPTVNSYKRLVKDYEAPVYLAWSIINRSALIRIPSERGEGTRIELRSPDGSINPYLAFAVVLQTCLDGIRSEIDPPAPIEKNLFQLSNNEIKIKKIKSLPENLKEALDYFEKSLVSKAALGDYLFEEFLNQKRDEWNEYRKRISKWETDKYIDS